MSKIPKVGFPSVSRIKPLTSQENIAAAAKKPAFGLGFKRPSEDNLLLLNGKRTKNNSGSVVKKNAAVPPPRPSANVEVAPPKRVVLQPIPDTGARCSMPAVSTYPKLPGSRRPKWDLKGKVQDMEEVLVAWTQRIAALEGANSSLQKDVEIKTVFSEEASNQLKKLEADLKKMTEEYVTTSKELSSLKVLYEEETTSLRSRVNSLLSQRNELQAQLDALEVQTMSLKRKEIEYVRENEQLKSRCYDQTIQIESLLKQVSTFETQQREGETIRRKLHNSVMELKGNIRVFCRLRPPLPEEQRNGMLVANIVPVDEKSIEIQQLSEISLTEGGSGTKNQNKYEFSFDCYFPPTSLQEQVFGEISQLVQSALDGYNVCIFAYGQTGSGKTFTMEGPSDIVDFVVSKDHPHLGMIPRSVQQIFTSIAGLELLGWKYKVETLFLEIYNERIQDLLNPQTGNSKCEIVKSGNKGTDCVISNVTTSEVTSAEEVYELLKKARINRAVAATKCNEYSSRSHYVFQMKITGENSLTNEKCEATLNLVDLAGSERVKESASVGERLVEAKAINKSLSNLGKVIMALSKKDSHIPYRDSKLTHLLANSLGGNSKTLMFVNISPNNMSLCETINSLRFATKVNQCKIGPAAKRIK